MTRVGWVVLTLIVLVVAGFAALTRFGGDGGRRSPGAISAVPDAALLVPVAGVARDAIRDSWGDARGGGRRHHGTDIPAPGGTPVIAAADGTVEKLFASALGGTTIYQRSSDRRRIYYYAHLSGYATGLHEGQGVRAGTTIGYVGDTGDAGAGNTHLHFGITRTAAAQRWWEGEDVNPYPLLARGGASR